MTAGNNRLLVRPRIDSVKPIEKEESFLTVAVFYMLLWFTEVHKFISVFWEVSTC